jgi:hypothetical protein
MPSNLLHKDRTQINTVKQVKKCSFCKRSNPVVAKFCGGCGRSTRFSHLESETVDAADSSDTSHQAARPTVTRHKKLTLRKFLCAYRKLTIFLLFVLLFGLSGALYISNPLPADENTARWSDFRAFLARKLEVPHYELDNVFFQLFAQTSDEKASIIWGLATSLEAFFQESFSQPGLTIFPNPFFEKPVSGNLTVPASDFFTDVPLNHPVYAATSPLKSLGVRCADSGNRIRPEEKMTWEAWKQITGDIMRTLSLETSYIERLCAGRKGAMTNLDIRNFAEHMREKLFIKNTAPLIYARETFFPSRIEAFGVLSSLIKELQAGM